MIEQECVTEIKYLDMIYIVLCFVECILSLAFCVFYFTVENGSSQRRVGSISDYDPMNDRYGSITGSSGAGKSFDWLRGSHGTSDWSLYGGMQLKLVS